MQLVQLFFLGQECLKLFSAAINFYWAARAIGCGPLPGRLATVALCWRGVAELFHNDTVVYYVTGVHLANHSLDVLDSIIWVVGQLGDGWCHWVDI